MYPIVQAYGDDPVIVINAADACPSVPVLTSNQSSLPASTPPAERYYQSPLSPPAR